MKIYQSEIDDGVGDLVKSSASIAYCSVANFGELDWAQDGAPQMITITVEMDYAILNY